MDSYIIVNGVEIYIFRAKDSEANAALLCLENVSKNYSVDNMKNTGLYRYIYAVSVDYDSIDADDILGIHKNFMKKRNINKCLYLFKKCFWDY